MKEQIEAIATRLNKMVFETEDKRNDLVFQAHRVKKQSLIVLEAEEELKSAKESYKMYVENEQKMSFDLDEIVISRLEAKGLREKRELDKEVKIARKELDKRRAHNALRQDFYKDMMTLNLMLDKLNNTIMEVNKIQHTQLPIINFIEMFDKHPKTGKLTIKQERVLSYYETNGDEIVIAQESEDEGERKCGEIIVQTSPENEEPQAV